MLENEANPLLMRTCTPYIIENNRLDTNLAQIVNFKKITGLRYLEVPLKENILNTPRIITYCTSFIRILYKLMIIC